MRVWLDGELRDVRKAGLSPLDRGVLFGDGVFETLRSYRGKPFLLGEHLARLAAGAAAVGIPMPPEAPLREAVGAVLDANGLGSRDARVRLTLTRGGGGGGLWPDPPGPPTALVTAQPLDLPAWVAAGGGAQGITSAQRVLSGAAHVKSTSFQAHVLAKGEAHRAGAWEALLRNERGEVAEGATSNVFAVVDGALLTPPPEAGILPGLTRAVVLRLAPALGIAAREAPLLPAQLAGAAEAFLTSSVAEVVPLVGLDGRPVGAGAPGPVARALRAAYAEEVARVLGLSETGSRNEPGALNKPLRDG